MDIMINIIIITKKRVQNLEICLLFLSASYEKTGTFKQFFLGSKPWIVRGKEYFSHPTTKEKGLNVFSYLKEPNQTGLIANRIKGSCWYLIKSGFKNVQMKLGQQWIKASPILTLFDHRDHVSPFFWTTFIAEIELT